MPELACRDLARSRAFYEDIVGADIAYQRDGFVYLTLGDAQLMLEQAPGGWETGPLDFPYGRGINFQIEIDDVDALAFRLETAGIGLFCAPAENWYRAGDIEHGQKEVLVQDPDGYLLRFITVIGNRPAGAA